MQSYSVITVINTDRAEVFKALTTKEGLSGWWTADCEISSKMGGTNTFRFGEMYVIMQIEKIVEEREVVWRCIDQYFKFENVRKTNDWVGTVIEFRLEKNEYNSTIVHFIHEGLTSKLVSYEPSTILWSYLINFCLKGYLEKNQRTPQPIFDETE